MKLTVTIEREVDERWIAEITELPGVMAYGATPIEAFDAVKALAFRVLADKIEHREMPRVDGVEFVPAAA